MEEDNRYATFLTSTDVNREFEDIETGSFLIQDDILQPNEKYVLIHVAHFGSYFLVLTIP